jgi:CheY-like chemotaxis protein
MANAADPRQEAARGDGVLGLEEFHRQQENIALVITDMMMPDVDGFAVAERIKASPAHARAAVLMLTSSGRPGDLDRCRELGIAVHLLKPVAQGELLEAVARALHPVARRLDEEVARLPERHRVVFVLCCLEGVSKRDAARRQMEEWRHGLWIIRNAIVRRHGQDAWAATSAEVWKLRPAAPR